MTRTVSARLNYSAPLTPAGPRDGWVITASADPPGVARNFRLDGLDVTITDLRGTDLRPTLDVAGFELAAGAAPADPEAVAENSGPALRQYRQRTAELLAERTGADDVVVFDETLRREDTGSPPTGPNQSAHQRVHVDQNPRSALARAERHGTGRPFRRFQIVNVWRPLLHPVRNYPLALCDYRSLDPGTDLVVTALEFSDWLSDRENFSVRFNPDHRWFYWSTLSPAEALIFKCYDSASRSLALGTGGTDRPELRDVAGLCPHTAFVDPDGPTSGRLRTSVELRALLFHR